MMEPYEERKNKKMGPIEFYSQSGIRAVVSTDAVYTEEQKRDAEKVLILVLKSLPEGVGREHAFQAFKTLSTLSYAAFCPQSYLNK